MQLTLILYGPHSTASTLLRWIAAALEAQYDPLAPAIVPHIDAMLMILPSMGACLIICLACARAQSHSPVRLTSITRAHSALDCCSSSPEPIVPALFTAISDRPNFSTTE